MTNAPEEPGRAAALDLLRFYAEAGVDAALSEAAVDRFELTRVHAEQSARAREAERQLRMEKERAEATAREQRFPEPPPEPPRPALNLTVPSESAIMAAREAAATAA